MIGKDLCVVLLCRDATELECDGKIYKDIGEFVEDHGEQTIKTFQRVPLGSAGVRIKLEMETQEEFIKRIFGGQEEDQNE